MELAENGDLSVHISTYSRILWRKSIKAARISTNSKSGPSDEESSEDCKLCTTPKSSTVILNLPTSSSARITYPKLVIWTSPSYWIKKWHTLKLERRIMPVPKCGITTRTVMNAMCGHSDVCFMKCVPSSHHSKLRTWTHCTRRFNVVSMRKFRNDTRQNCRK